LVLQVLVLQDEYCTATKCSECQSCNDLQNLHEHAKLYTALYFTDDNILLSDSYTRNMSHTGFIQCIWNVWTTPWTFHAL